MTGSGWRKRARGITSRMASMTSMVARTSCAFSSTPRAAWNGFRQRTSPPAQARNDISLMGAIIASAGWRDSAASQLAKARACAPGAPGTRREHVDVGRPAEVHQVPDQLHAVLLGGAQHRQRRPKVVLPRAGLGAHPRDAVAAGGQAGGPRPREVGIGQHIVPRRRREVEPASVLEQVARAFEPAQEERLEQGVRPARGLCRGPVGTCGKVGHSPICVDLSHNQTSPPLRVEARASMTKSAQYVMATDRPSRQRLVSSVRSHRRKVEKMRIYRARFAGTAAAAPALRVAAEGPTPARGAASARAATAETMARLAMARSAPINDRYQVTYN